MSDGQCRRDQIRPGADQRRYYPTDYGYLRGTLGQDGGPLDALVCLREPTFSGCLIPVKPVGMFKMRDEKGVEDRIIGVPLDDPYLEQARDAE